MKIIKHLPSQFNRVALLLATMMFLAATIIGGGFNTVLADTSPSEEEVLTKEDVAGKAALDMKYGEEINELCAGCHGEFGQGSTDGEYPRLAGLDRQYLVTQLQYFKDRSRLNIPMLPYATERELPDQDVQAVAAFLSSIKLPSKLPPVDELNFDSYARLQASRRVVNIARYPGDVDAGNKFYSRECGSCHGQDGMGKPDKQAPRLVGQHSIYLLRQMQQISSGKRLHDEPGDAETFSQFSDAEIDNMLAWLSVQDD